MEIAYFGKGRVGSLCREVVERLGIKVLEPRHQKKADFWISVHWPKKFTPEELKTPLHGCVNLHNSYLPWNKGAHPCTWAIIDKTRHGATMHWMDEQIDTGDILCQEEVEVTEYDTAATLYEKTVAAEVKVFEKGVGLLNRGLFIKTPQPSYGSRHLKRDFERLVRAMTTSDSFVVRK
jgi:methionyl-tRNA formyltransferase